MTNNKQVMLAEDDPAMRAVLKTLLELEGYTVITTPKRARLSQLQAEIHNSKPDILLLDVHLGEVNGIDLIKALRSDPGLGFMRILMSSGMDLRDACLTAGADDFLLKPYMPDELLNKIKQLQMQK